VVDPSITLEEDAQRRDFTFNALYKIADPSTSVLPDGSPVVIDPTGNGLDDLQRRIIRVTHYDSFRDDPLRILRALRFVARGYDLEAETLALMHARRPTRSRA
jgi:tRNA nucleotidyltransferase (CCA-adding enzyme)